MVLFIAKFYFFILTEKNPIRLLYINVLMSSIQISKNKILQNIKYQCLFWNQNARNLHTLKKKGWEICEAPTKC